MEKLPKKYISVDIEASGPYPWRSSMLSLGACVVDQNLNKTFYAELKPITLAYNLEHFKIGARSLNCLRDYHFDNFRPNEVLNILKREGNFAGDEIKRFGDWINFVSEGHRPFLCATPIKFEGMFLSYYFDKFLGKDPFGHSGEDIQSIFRGNVHDLNADLEEMSLREEGHLTHNALEDAIQQAKEFYVTLVYMRQHNLLSK